MMFSLIAALAVQAAALPSCADAEFDGTHTDCGLAIEDGRDLSLAFDFESGGDFGESATVTVTRGGAPLSTFEVSGIESFLYPELLDVDQDGHTDLLIPLITGTVNTIYSLHLGTAEGVAAEGVEISGHTVSPLEPGLFSVSARSSAVSHYVEYFNVADGLITSEAVILNTFTDEDTLTCTLESGEAPRGEDFYCGTAVMTE